MRPKLCVALGFFLAGASAVCAVVGTVQGDTLFVLASSIATASALIVGRHDLSKLKECEQEEV